MDLIEILDKNLKTKNRIRDILGETNNISRYPIAIHNAIAVKYNEGWVYGYKERYFELTGTEPDVNDPEDIYEYGIDDTYYDPSYTTDVLTEIMKDCLNYRLGMKDELVIDTDEFVTYPDYLLGKIDSAYDLGLAAGKDQADEDYDGDEDVDAPVVVNDRNKVTITSEQDNVRIKYKFDENGVEYEYSSPIIISEDCTLYVIGIIGRSNSGWEVWNLSYDPTGYAAFIDPPVVEQDGNLVYLSCSLKNSTIEYKIDNKTWNIYTHPVGVTNNDVYIYARSSRNGEFSSIIVQPIKHDISIVRPENVQCTITDEGSVRRITLYCPTPNTEIWYSLNTSAIPDAYFQYNGSFTTEHTRFTVYAYSQFTEAYGGTESPQRLYWKYDKYEDERPQKVNFYPNGRDLTLSCTTEGAVIIYQYGTYGTPQNSGSNYITLQPANGTKVIAYAVLNGIQGDVSEYIFNISGSAVPPSPYAYKDENEIIHLVSSYPGKYTIDGNDPSIGIPFNDNVEIPCNYTITLKAVAYNGNVASEMYVATFYPGSTAVTPGTGGSGGQGTGDTNFDSSKDWFWMRGGTGVTLTGSDKGKLQYSTGGNWVTVQDNTTFNSNSIVYLRAVGLSNFNPNGTNVEIGGNINSLKDGQNFGLNSEKAYTGLFKNATAIAQAVQIHLTNTNSVSYESMFEGCYNLLSTPEILPLTIIPNAGYKNMFKGCTKLSTAPVLPATSIGSNGYESMFEGCINLISAPALPAGSLTSNCYARMFKGCTRLAQAPALPSDSLAMSCYEEMFMNCTSLTKAPYLPAVQLLNKTSCYAGMFNGCSNLNYIKAMFINNPSSGAYTANWVKNVAQTGTFVQNEEARWFHEGPNGIPEGWTVVNGAVTGTVQFNYNQTFGELEMTSTTNDPIYWIFDDKTVSKNLWNLYDGPVPITRPCTVWACCKNKDNIYSEEVSYTINNVTYPKITATVLNGEVSISSVFQYDSIQWGLCSGENVEPSQWNDYRGKITTITEDTWIAMRGYINGLAGGPQRQDWQYIIPSLTAPTFGPARSNANNTTVYCQITWIGSSSFTNPEILISKDDESHYMTYNLERVGMSNNWSYDLSFNWSDIGFNSVIYYAKVRVTKNGVTVESTAAPKTFTKGEDNEEPTVQPLTPGISAAGTNQWYITYPDEYGVHQVYPVWNNDVPEIWYSMGGETAKNYKTDHPIDLSTMRTPPSFGGQVLLRVWSRTSPTNVSDPFEQYVTYDAEAVIPTPGLPSINITENPNNPQQPYKFTITNDYYSGYSMVHEYTITITEYAGEQQSGFALSGTLNEGSVVYIPAWVSKATINARTCVYMQLVGEKWSDWTTYSNNFINNYNPSNLSAPGHHFSEDPQSAGQYILYVDVDSYYINKYPGGTIYRYFSVTDPEWGRPSTTVNFNSTYVLETGYRFATAGSGNFYGGHFSVWWEYHVTGIDPIISAVEEFDWRNPDAPEGLKAPIISDLINEGKLIITNPNSGYDTYWKIENAQWAGGVVNEDKYNFNPPKRWTWVYGLTLDEFLISGTVVAWSEDDEGNLTDELKTTRSFVFTNNTLNAPTITFKNIADGNNYNDEIQVFNTNKYCTSYWQWAGESIWHKANKYGNSISSSQSNAYAYAYSIWGNQRTNTVSAYYDSGRFTSYAPPSIRTEKNNGDNSYTLIITNNSTLDVIKWKIDPTEWNLDATNEWYTNYQKDTGDRYLVFTKNSPEYDRTNNTVSVRLNPNLVSGFIQAFSTDDYSPMPHGAIDSSLTTYQFVNGNYSI